jgi:hypothetical protein
MEEPISGFQVAYAIMGDSMVELLSVVCAACLAILLNQPAKKGEISDFSTRWYRISTGILPMILSMYFHKKQMGCTSSTSETEQEQYLLFLTSNDNNNPDNNDNNMRGFPVVFVFQIIVSCCLFFMQFQAQAQQKNVQMVLQLKQAVDETRDKKKKK